MTESSEFFHRPALTKQMIDRVLDESPIASAKSGMFLFAPRRTGKSTFIREDLRPTLSNAGATVIYTDLWVDKDVDPAEHITVAIKSEISRHENVLKKLIKKSGINKVGGFGVSIHLDIGSENGLSITEALVALSDEIKKPIVLIIDEAQDTLKTKNGTNAMFSLKAARDELNSSSHYGLRIIATGSNQSKLAHLTNGKGQAFFGANTVKFPPLGKDYIDWFLSHYRYGNQLNADFVYDLFKQSNFQPEHIKAAASHVENRFGLEQSEVATAFAEAVQEEIKKYDLAILQKVNTLPGSQYAVLKVMANAGDLYAPFSKETRSQYIAALEEFTGEKVDAFEESTIQKALSSLIDKGFVWNESRGLYLVDDTSVSDFFSRNKEAITSKKARRQKV